MVVIDYGISKHPSSVRNAVHWWLLGKLGLENHVDIALSHFSMKPETALDDPVVQDYLSICPEDCSLMFREVISSKTEHFAIYHVDYYIDEETSDLRTVKVVAVVNDDALGIQLKLSDPFQIEDE